jgi:hypothetical protein
MIETFAGVRSGTGGEVWRTSQSGHQRAAPCPAEMIHPMRTSRVMAIVAALLGPIVGAFAMPVVAQESSWSPFKQSPETDAPRPPKGMARPGEPIPDRANLQPDRSFGVRSNAVEHGELDPVMAPDNSGLPLDLWRGLDLTSFEEHLSRLELPPRSPVLHQLWRRMLLSAATPPTGAPSTDHLLALRLEALYRSGMLGDMTEVITNSGSTGPLVLALSARKEIGLGRHSEGCRNVASLAAPSAGLPGRLKGEAQLLMGYCAAKAGDAQGADLAANLAREEGVEAELPLTVLAGVADGTKPQVHLPKRVLLLDYRFLELLGPVNGTQIFDKAEPALLAALALDTATEARLRIAAAETALRLNALSPEVVADLYRRYEFSRGELADPAVSRDPLLRRALLFRGTELSRSPPQQARLAKALLDEARRTSGAVQTARMLAPLLDSLRPGPDTDSFSEIAVEIALAAGQFDTARRWAEGTGAAQHWQALVDIADPARRGGRLQSLRPIEDLAVRGRLSPESLHRLATVLDALDIDVPVPLWDAASRTPQPSGGYLPDTGVLADLSQSAKRGDAGRTILLVMRTLGADGPQGANILALGDSVRGLKAIGLEADARRLGLEALLPVWPRLAAN